MNPARPYTLADFEKERALRDLEQARRDATVPYYFGG